MPGAKRVVLEYVVDGPTLKNKKGYQNCVKLEIYSAKMDEKIDFEIFKSFNECISIGIGGGRIQPYSLKGSEGILVTTSDADNDIPGNKAQNDNSIFGKIVLKV